MSVPDDRLHPLNDRAEDAEADWVVYWMVANRRTRSNPALQRAVELANQHRKPLVVLEALRVGYRWASDRHHRFVMDGMEDNRAALEAAGVTVVSYVEPEPGAGSGLLEALAERAVAVVTDLWPCFFVPHMQAAAAARVPCAMVAVDGIGMLPMSRTDRAYPTAHGLRRHLQRTLPEVLWFPEPSPLDDYRQGQAALGSCVDRWASATELAELLIDHDVAPVGKGGPAAGEAVISRFLDERLPRYADDRRNLDEDASSGLSPYLHYGHVSAADVVQRVLEAEDWSPEDFRDTKGSRGWWGVSEATEGFLDEIVTWREVGHVFAFHRPDDFDTYASVPDWARATLQDHADDPRTVVPRDALEAAESPDELWNAAQRQLVECGIIHNAARMLWGKLVLAWSATPAQAFDTLTHLNNKYALDGRDPNSASGIAWVFGRHDRAWGPERPIYGKVRYMTSRSTGAKLRNRRWLEQFGKG